MAFGISGQCGITVARFVVGEISLDIVPVTVLFTVD